VSCSKPRPGALAYPDIKLLSLGMALFIVGAFLLALGMLFYGQPGILIIFPFFLAVGGAPLSSALLVGLLVLMAILVALLVFYTYHALRMA